MADYRKPKFGGRVGGGSDSRPSSGGGNSSYGHKGSYGGRKDERQLFDATCSNCNKSCKVPFEPNGKKPVFCKDCFVKDAAPARDFDRSAPRSYDRSERRDDRRPASFTPTVKPAAPDVRIDGLVRGIDALNQKMETVIELLRAQALHDVVTEVVKKKAIKK